MKKAFLALFLILFLAVLAGSAFAAGTIQWPTACWVDSNGDPLSGGKLYSYAAGTTTAKALYSDRDATSAHTNPEILDSNGCTEVYGIGEYKLVLKDSADATTYFTIDYVTVSTREQNFYYPNYAAADQGATGNSDTIKYWIDTCSSNNCTITLQNNSGSATTTYTFATSETVPSNIRLVFEEGALIADSGSNPNLTLNGDIQAGNFQIFSWGNGSGSLTFGKKIKQTNVIWATGHPDGTTNNSTGFQAIVTGSTGIEIIIPATESNYRVKAITLPSNTTLRGLGMPTLQLAGSAVANNHVLKNSDASGGNSDIKIIGIDIDGDDANQTTYHNSAIYFFNVDGFEIRDSKLHDIYQTSTDIGAIHIEESSDGKIKDNEIYNFNHEGVYIRGSDNILVEENHFLAATSSTNSPMGTARNQADNTDATNIRFIRNVVENSTYWASAISLNAVGSEAAGNFIWGVSQTKQRAGVQVGHADHPSSRVRVHHNEIHNCPVGIQVSYGAYSLIDHNYIEDTGLGIRINHVESTRSSILGNIINDSNDNATIGSPVDGYGILISGDDTSNLLKGLTITGNHVFDTEAHGLRAQFISNTEITGNTFRNTGDATTGTSISLEEFTNSDFSHNNIEDSRGATVPAIGISTDVDATNSNIINNIISGPTAKYGGTLDTNSYIWEARLRSNSGSPAGSLTPNFKGEICIDTAADPDDIYLAVGTGVNSWVKISYNP